ncbi:L-lysine 2,3-aminomutase [Mannheimia haemolytica]|uniref:L-lysine 2,3-aminomutase n=1 Tax=Mannheimia haemolytica TaxID=75985 RepID=A0A378N664_MANHA|nr:L-lysine 2,3-aminomutase [Mannheimia haemolytica]
MLKNSCAINCRYCFRRHFPYEEVKSGKAVWQQGLTYIAEHPELEEVILSGGDPLMAKDQDLDWILTQLEQISHIKNPAYSFTLAGRYSQSNYDRIM